MACMRGRDLFELLSACGPNVDELARALKLLVVCF